MVNMIRTQVSFDEREYILAKREAKAQNLIDGAIPHATRGASRPSPKRPWMRCAGVFEAGNPQSNCSIAEIVWFEGLSGTLGPLL